MFSRFLAPIGLQRTRVWLVVLVCIAGLSQARVEAQTPTPTATPTPTVPPPTATPTATPTPTVPPLTATPTATPTPTVPPLTATPTATPTPTVSSLTVTPTATATATPACSLVPPSLAAGTIGLAYSQQITVNGGTPPIVFSLIAGALPSGLTFTSGGLLSGTPTVAGSFAFTIRAVDANNCIAEAPYTLEIMQTVPATPAFFMVLLATMLAVASWVALRRQAR